MQNADFSAILLGESTPTEAIRATGVQCPDRVDSSRTERRRMGYDDDVPDVGHGGITGPGGYRLGLDGIDAAGSGTGDHRSDELPDPAEAPSSSKSRSYCFTVHFPNELLVTPKDVWLPKLTNGVRYLCLQLEIAPTTGKRHYQGFIYFSSARSFGSCKSLLTDAFGFVPHLERARGDPAANRAYCSKTDSAVPSTFFEHGVLPKHGNRSDLAELAAMITQGESLSAIAALNPAEYIRYHGGIKVLPLCLVY